MVVDDHDFQSYLPPHLTKSAGSVKLLQQQAGFADPLLCRAYIVQRAADLGVSALNLENVFCKLHVGYYTQLEKTITLKQKRTSG